MGSRIYLSMIALIIISLLVTGIVTIIFFKDQNENYHLGRLQRKENSIMLALNYYVTEREISEFNSKLDHKIDELADIHNLDFNIYNPQGTLLKSTVEESLKPNLAEPEINEEMLRRILNDTVPVIEKSFHQNENYLSTFFTVSSIQGAPVIIVHMPYFKDSRKNQEELRSFLSTLAQVFIFLFIGASILAYFLSNYITKSLSTIREGLERVKFKGSVKHLQWSGRDEIGALVDQYNSMVDELERSAELLAQSERESAWKEMARQVAHEIKNPLTPMKLNVQHMMRTLRDNPEDLPERFEKFAEIMGEQIDSLSRIATEFSDFAKMPTPILEELDLSEEIERVVELYKNAVEAEVVFEKSESDLIVLADKKQLQRVFNNLIINAIQSIPEGRSGKIVLTTVLKRDRVLAHVQDNGMGIPESAQSKIFKPYFTTKSGGTGLGLAMVYQMLKEFGASIEFQTEEGVGTKFTIAFSS